MALQVPPDILEQSAAPKERVEKVKRERVIIDPTPLLNAATIVLTALCRVLAERFMDMLRTVFPYFALGLAGYLLTTVMQDPSDRQLIGIGLYALLALGLLLIVRRNQG